MKTIFIVAGEPSGDAHAADLVKEIYRLDSSIICVGLGGPKMKQAGVHLFYDLTRLAVVGFWEVLENYNDFKTIFNNFLKQVDTHKPDCVILVDYPGFNLRLAKELRKRNIRVIYYISPQLWAWKEDRIEIIKSCVHRMLCLFAFEVDFYRGHQYYADFVGHPLIDQVQITTPIPQVFEGLELPSTRLTIGILPGSRRQEIEILLPIMMGAANIIHTKLQNIQFIILQSPNIEHDLFENLVGQPPFSVRIVKDEYYNALNCCDVCLVASGTATLETAILGKPMIVIYKTSLLTYLLAKWMVKIPDIGLVNIVSGYRAVPECVQRDATPEKIAAETVKMVENEVRLAEIRRSLALVKKTLGPAGASRRAAEHVIKFLNS